MDLTIKVDKITLNIRVAVIMETENGFIFEKHKNGYFFFLGGRVKAAESSFAAVKREIKEETGLTIDNLKFISIVENFFDTPEGKVHEICFVYLAEKQKKISVDFGLVELSNKEIENTDIRPKIIKDLIINNELDKISHFIA